MQKFGANARAEPGGNLLVVDHAGESQTLQHRPVLLRRLDRAARLPASSSAQIASRRPA